MANKKTAVFGIYHNADQAERVVERLREERFSNDDISVLLQDNQGTKDFAHEKNTKAPEGTTTGVTTGGVIGGTLGYWPGSALLRSPESVRLSLRVRSWARLQASGSAAPSVV